jgi:hypothetical protein
MILIMATKATRRTAIGRAVIAIVAIAVVMVVAIGIGTYILTGPHPIYCCTTFTSPCVETGFVGTLYVRVIADGTNQPVSGAYVTASIPDYCGSDETVDMGLTNSTGYSSGWSWSADYAVSVVYSGTDYTFPAPTSTGINVATLSVPSGIAVEITTGSGFNSAARFTTTVTAT